MLPQIASWTSQKRLRAGFWCSPLIAWGVYAAQVVLNLWLDPVMSSYERRYHPSDWLLVPLLVCWLAFWLACAAFAGLCAAFFWRNEDMPAETKDTLTLRSVLVTWSPTIILCCAWLILWIPFLAYLVMFRYAVDKGIDFWKSNRPRQWIGDFDEPDSPNEG